MMVVGQGGGTNAAPAKPSKLTKLTLIRGVLKRHCCDLGKVSISMHGSNARKEIQQKNFQLLLGGCHMLAHPKFQHTCTSTIQLVCVGFSQVKLKV